MCHHQTKPPTRWSLFGLCLFLLCVSSTPVWASTPWAKCSKWLESKEAERAAACYEKLVNDPAAKQKAQRNPIQKKLRGFYIINAAKLFRKVATQEPNAQQKAYLYERANVLLRQYLHEKLCLQKYKCEAVNKQHAATSNLIRYAQLHLVTENKTPITVKVIGYKYKKSFTLPPNQNTTLRPGPYKLFVYREGTLLHEKSVELLPEKNKYITLSSSKTKRWEEQKRCKGLYKESKWLAAASCFGTLAKSLSKDERAPLQRGTLLLASARAYLRAAKQETIPLKAAHYKERALLHQQDIVQQQLCIDVAACTNLQQQNRQLAKQLHYAQLTLRSTTTQPVSIYVQGYRYAKRFTFTGSWKKNLLPGQYKLQITHKGHTAQETSLSLKPEETKRVVLPPPTEAHKGPPKTSVQKGPLPWIISGAGLAIAITGAVLLGIGSGNVQDANTQAEAHIKDRNALLQETDWRNWTHITSKWSTTAKEITTLYDTGTFQTGAGIALLGTGGAILLTGAVLLLLPSNTKKTSSHTSPALPTHSFTILPKTQL